MTAGAALTAMPADLPASFRRIVELINDFGLDRIREFLVKHLEGPVWEMRMKGRDGSVSRLCDRHGTPRRRGSHLPETDAENAAPRNRDRPQTGEGGKMTARFIPSRRRSARGKSTRTSARPRR